MQLYTKIIIGMALGVVLGFLVGPNSAMLNHDGVRLTNAARILVDGRAGAAVATNSSGIRSAKIIERKGNKAPWLKVKWQLSNKDVFRLQKAAQDALAKKTGKPSAILGAEGPKYKIGAAYSGWVKNVEPAVSTYSLFGQTLVDYTEWIGRLFLALIKMVVVPLVFFSLTVGVASLGDFRRLGRLGGRTIGLFTVTTVMSLIIGVGLANIIKPGDLMSVGDRAKLLASYEGAATNTVANAADAPSTMDQIIAIVPSNPVASIANGDMLQIIFFALMFGIALTLLSEERSKPVITLLDNCNEAMVMLVHIAMMLAPIGVAALLFKVVGSTGLSVLVALSVYGLVVVAGLMIHLILVYGSIVKFGAKLPFLRFLKAIRPALMLAFSTSSSSATLPVT
ncbi:MAG: dicarboxylate/amino acid:cation symporter, partial [Polyangiaceae bacterium]